MGQIKTFFKRISSAKYVYNESRYKDSFVATVPEQIDFKTESTVPRKIYCCWTGENEMSPDRLRAFEALKAKVGVEVVLVTPANLNSYILSDFPLHKGYQYLSLIQKSDYLRCYLMHHYGGGYTDIKVFSNSWESAFKKLENNPSKWAVGYREIGKRGVAKVDGVMGNDLKMHWHLLLGNCSFICRPYTPLTQEWYNELLKRMDFYYDDLVKHPGDAFGNNPGYAIPWAYIMGHIFHPLCLKYHKKLLYSRALKFVPKSYR